MGTLTSLSCLSHIAVIFQMVQFAVIASIFQGNDHQGTAQKYCASDRVQR